MSIHDAQALSERLASPPPVERRACNAAAIRAAGYGCHALAAERAEWEATAERLTDVWVILSAEANRLGTRLARAAVFA